VTTVDWIATIEWWGAVLASLVFVVLYMRTRWWRRWEGRVVMGLHSVIIWLAVLGVMLQVFGPDYYGRDVLRVLAFSCWFVVMWGFVILLIRAQRAGRRTIAETNTEATDLVN
jgi:MFS superfamily sulfate permease-like transporter